jgi:hypothetical protein
MFSKIREKRHRDEKLLKVTLKEYYWIHHPRCYRNLESWVKWGELQTKILAKLHSCFTDTHVYIRFSTYLPEHYSDIIQSENVEKNITKIGKETIILFADCQNQKIWRELLSSSGLEPLAHCFFLLKEKPDNWQKIVNDIYEILLNFDKGHSLTKFQSELSSYSCLCFSEDEDLVIGKVDLPEQEILGILKELAFEDGLELEIERKD